MVDFKKHTDKPLSSRTEPAEERAPSAIPLPPGCYESEIMGAEPITDLEIGQALTGTIVEVKPVQTAAMKNSNNLITFHDEALGRIKFWSSGALNQLIGTGIHLIGKPLTIQRIEDEHFKKGDGRNWRIFDHSK